MSTFAESYGYDGESLEVVFDHRTFGMTIDSVHEQIGLDQPDYVKLDVDGIEHLILAGASNVLRSVQSVLVEVNDALVRQAEAVSATLSQAGLRLAEKRQPQIVVADEFATTFNQIWTRR